VYTGVNPSFALSLLQNSMASYHVTCSTGYLSGTLKKLELLIINSMLGDIGGWGGTSGYSVSVGSGRLRSCRKGFFNGSFGCVAYGVTNCNWRNSVVINRRAVSDWNIINMT